MNHVDGVPFLLFWLPYGLLSFTLPRSAMGLSYSFCGFRQEDFHILPIEANVKLGTLGMGLSLSPRVLFEQTW